MFTRSRLLSLLTHVHPTHYHTYVLHSPLSRRRFQHVAVDSFVELRKDRHSQQDQPSPCGSVTGCEIRRERVACSRVAKRSHVAVSQDVRTPRGGRAYYLIPASKRIRVE